MNTIDILLEAGAAIGQTETYISSIYDRVLFGPPYGMRTRLLNGKYQKGSADRTRFLLKIASALLEHGAKIRNAPGSEPVWMDAFNNNGAVVQFYIDRGLLDVDGLISPVRASLCLDDNESPPRKTPLGLAVTRRAQAVAEVLIAAGCDFFKQDENEKTPLNYAEDDEMVKILYANR